MATKRTGAKKTALVKPSGSDVLAGYDELLRDLKARIGQAQVRTSVAVNSELVLLLGASSGTSLFASSSTAGARK